MNRYRPGSKMAFIAEQEAKEEKARKLRDEERRWEEEQQRKTFRHNWKTTIFGTIGGAMAGLLASIIFWLLTSK